MSDAIQQAIMVLDQMDERLDAHGYLLSDNPRVDIANAISGLQALQHSGEPVYAFRRKGVDDFCTCDAGRYLDLKAKPDFFEVAIFYTTPQPAVRLTDAQIREVFLANGFTIKDGQTDLKPYVYQAARALLSAGKENNNE